MPLIPEDPNTGKIAVTDAGPNLYVNHTEQGRFYWSDAIAGGVQVWFPSQVPAELLTLAIEAEEGYAAADEPVDPPEDPGDTEGAPL